MIKLILAALQVLVGWPIMIVVGSNYYPWLKSTMVSLGASPSGGELIIFIQCFVLILANIGGFAILLFSGFEELEQKRKS